MREKSAIQKTKVHKALKITTPEDSDDSPGPKENPLPEKEPMVETDQNACVEGENESVQKDNTTHAEDAPNSEKKNDSPNTSDKNGNEVNLIFFPQISLFLQTLNCFN
jgi:hypothetical protein